MSANIEQIKAMLERTGKTNLLQKQKVDLDKERLQLEATVNIEKIDKSPEVDLEKASRNVYESWKGGTMDDFLQDMVELGKALNTRKEE